MAKKFKLTKKKVLATVGVVGLLVLAVAAGVLVQLLIRQNSPENTTNGPISEPLPAPVTEAQDLRGEGKIEESEQKITEALEDPSTNNDTRYLLYIQQGHGFMEKEQWQQAIDAYLKAHAIQETKEVSDLLGDAYQFSGNNEKAIEYYKKAIGLIPQDNPRYDAVKRELEDKIRELGGQP